MQIGLVGKPSSGKSTFFKAATLVDVPISPVPFTTIHPNVGVGYVSFDCVCKEFGVRCNPRRGFCKNGKRFVPIKLIDVGGLIPGSHEGRGIGNKFMDSLRQADGLIQIADFSGLTDEEGKPTKGFEPEREIKFLEEENSAYRIVGDEITEITDEIEKEIEERAGVLITGESGSGKSVLLIDDASSHSYEIKELMNAIGEIGIKNIKILMAERKDRWAISGITEYELEDNDIIVKELKLTEKDVENFFRKEYGLEGKELEGITQFFIRAFMGKKGEFIFLLLLKKEMEDAHEILKRKFDDVFEKVDEKERKLLKRIFVIQSYEGRYPKNAILKLGNKEDIVDKLNSLEKKGHISRAKFIETYHPALCNEFIKMGKKEFPAELLIQHLEEYLENIEKKREYFGDLFGIGTNIAMEKDMHLNPGAVKFLKEAIKAKGKVSFLFYMKGWIENAYRHFAEVYYMEIDLPIRYECGVAYAALLCLENELYDAVVGECWKHRNEISSSARVVLEYLVERKEGEIKEVKNEKGMVFKDLMEKLKVQR